MIETDVNQPEVKEKKTSIPKPKKINLDELTQQQRRHLKDGMQDTMTESAQFRVLGSDQKVIFYSAAYMLLNNESLKMLDIEGEDYFKEVDVIKNGKVSTELGRFYKFTWDYTVPGSTKKMRAVREWRYEEF